MIRDNRLFSPELLVVVLAGLAYKLHWARVWLISGAPIVSYLLSIEKHKKHIQPSAALPPEILLLLVNIACAAASTSWLFYWLFTAACWTANLVLALSKYEATGDFARHRLRNLLRQLQFTADKVALFNLPALEIDVDVAGLMVVRGVTLSLSSLTIEAHGIEIGIKLSDDMELAIQTDKVTVALFRRVEIDEIYANIKGGEYEMTFGKLEENSKDPHGDALMDNDTPLLKAAHTWSSQDASKWKTPNKIRMTEKMTDGHSPRATSAEQGAEMTTKLVADDKEAAQQYSSTMDHIARTSEINIARKNVNRSVAERMESGGSHMDLHNISHIRAAVCSQLHDKASIQHPPQQSVKVSTLKNMSSPATRKFMHRLPMLLRLLLNPLTYFHPVSISSITATASGRWIQSLLGSEVFKSYADKSSDVRKLRDRVFSWLTEANFAVQFANVKAGAHVPFLPEYDIQCRVSLEDMVAYRTLPREINLGEVVNLSGADATVYIPSFLLPHHEHLLPSLRERAAEAQKQRAVLTKNPSMSQVVQAKKCIEQDQRDETNCRLSAHVRLPARFDQELLNFIAALVKATKIIEFERGHDEAGSGSNGIGFGSISGGGGDGGGDDGDDSTSGIHGFREFGRVFSNQMKDGLKKATINAAANDRWIAKLVGKVTSKLTVMQGDVGYSGNIPVALGPYRAIAERERKILP